MHIAPELLTAAFPYVGVIFTPLVGLGGVALGEYLKRKNDDRSRASQREDERNQQIADSVAEFIASARQLRLVIVQQKDHQKRRSEISGTFTQAGVDPTYGMQAVSMVEEQRRDLVRRRNALDDKMSTEAARLQLQAPELFGIAGNVASTIEKEPDMTADKLEGLLQMLAVETAKFLDGTDGA